MIKITFLDGNLKSFQKGITAESVARSISNSLAKESVAAVINGVTNDLSSSLHQDCQIKFVKRDDPEALELIRHDCAHVLAEAVQTLWPATKVAIGPVTENGFFYDFLRDPPFTKDDLTKIEKQMRRIIKANRKFSYEIVSREQARSLFEESKEEFKVALLNQIPEGEEVKIYSQETWNDLCRGPHMTSTGKIGEAFQLTKVAGAYWRGDKNSPMLSRIYGTAWSTKEELNRYLMRIEEAEKRDHRKIGRIMDLFHFEEDAPGAVFWHPGGWLTIELLKKFIQNQQSIYNYHEVDTPQILDRKLWEQSGHWDKYRENMFVTHSEDKRVFAIKPMNCPGHVKYFASKLRSYRDLPLRVAEFGKVHRNEPSGSLHGIMRVVAFTQDDAHIFVTEEQIKDEVIKVNNLIINTYIKLGFNNVKISLSTRPAKRIGSDSIWDQAEKALQNVIETGKQKWSINKGDGAFYGPKLDYYLTDALGRQWQCASVQLDFNLPGRLGASYIDNNGDKKVPILIHRVILGSIERFFGILLEHLNGHLPLWLTPIQVVVANIVSESEDYAKSVNQLLQNDSIRSICDTRNEKISYKIRQHFTSKVPIMLVCGEREKQNKTVTIKKYGTTVQETVSLDQALSQIKQLTTMPSLNEST